MIFFCDNTKMTGSSRTRVRNTFYSFVISLLHPKQVYFANLQFLSYTGSNNMVCEQKTICLLQLTSTLCKPRKNTAVLNHFILFIIEK